MILNTISISTLIFAFAYLCTIIVAYLISDSMIFPKIPVSYEPDLTTKTLDSDTGDKIATAFLPANHSKKLLLYSHGNGEDIGQIYPTLKEFQRRGLSTLAYDYPGYGRSSGTATETSVYRSAETAYTYATSELGFDAKNIFLYGRSLGSGPSCWLAEKYVIGGLILEGAFSSTFRVKTRWKLLPFDKFDNLKRLPQIKSPLLLIHGKLDTTVPFRHALTNHSAATSEVESFWVDQAGHNTLPETAGNKYWETVLLFVSKH